MSAEMGRRAFLSRSAGAVGAVALLGAGLGSEGCVGQEVFESEIDGTLLEATRRFAGGDVEVERSSFQTDDGTVVEGVLVTGINGSEGSWRVYVTDNQEWVDRSVDSYYVNRGQRIYWEYAG